MYFNRLQESLRYLILMAWTGKSWAALVRLSIKALNMVHSISLLLAMLRDSHVIYFAQNYLFFRCDGWHTQLQILSGYCTCFSRMDSQQQKYLLPSFVLLLLSIHLLALDDDDDGDFYSVTLAFRQTTCSGCVLLWVIVSIDTVLVIFLGRGDLLSWTNIL